MKGMRLGAVGLAVIAPVAVWLLATAVFGARLVVPGQSGGPPLDIGWPAVVAIALVAGLLGWGLLAGLEKLTRRARTIWTITAVVVLALSFGLLIGPGIAASTRTWLGLMHLAAGGVLIFLLPSRKTKRAQSPGQQSAKEDGARSG
ncbi:hypothetical protein GCM10009765_39520 [Fodinicola feengrottensis]|uniref:Uncharacterized protein n=1 Tax=Fodinicola feengrottensis TaxID=435914 RepID=A0ABN2HEF5_9ACTN